MKSTIALVLGLIAGVAGCGALDVSDPTAIEDGELNDAAGAALLRGAALKALADAADDGAYWSGLLADEFFFDTPAFFQQSGTVSTDEMLDRRESVRFEQLPFGNDDSYRNWQNLRRAATVAMPKLRTYAPAGAREAHVGEMFALRGVAALRLAEDFCPGFPLNDVVDLNPVFNAPLSTEDALERALADLDSAVAYAADSARVLHFAKVGRARTLLELGRFAEADAALEGVPTDYVATVEYSEGVGLINRLFFGSTRSVANQEGGTELDFVEAGDPRVEVTLRGTARDGVTEIYRIAKYPSREAPLVLVNGIEARLIEAEAALNADDPSWLTILNDLRSNQIAPALPALTDPGSFDARVDLLFRERAFWLFATGHRLADLRRLIRLYDRPAESVFPTGPYRLGGTYGTATSIPFPAALETPYNPAITGCTSR